MTARRVGSYEIVRVLARGGMAVVYLARQPALDREVALKQLDFETGDPALAQRFVREARLAAALDHPNVVTLFDFFEDGGVPYIAMEHVAGGSLRPLVGRLELPQVFRVLEGVLAGLGHAERLGIAHRDLKPENVLLTRGGSVKIADFGIARAYNALTGQLTSTGTAIGTPAYMAPEQALDERLGPYTDLYAVGVMAYELLAGRPPFDPGGPAMTVLYCHVNKLPPPLADQAPDVPRAVCDWVEWLLAKRPADRPPSAATAWEALEEIAVAELGPYWRRGASIATPPERAPAPPPVDDPGEAVTTVEGGESATAALGPTPAPVSRPPPRRRLGLALVAGAAALAGTAAAVALIGDDSEEPGAAAAVRSAAPYDFDGDGHRQLVLGMPGSGRSQDGIVVVQSRNARDSTLITPAAARLPRPHRREDLFGVSPASADFNRDGYADLAIAAPGRNTVSVLYGSSHGLEGARAQTITAARTDLPAEGGAYGSKLLATDLDGDGYADLAIGAPGEEIVPGSGAVQIVFGHRSGLRPAGARTLRSPQPTYAGFGSRMRAGDVDGDGRVDLIEGSRDKEDGPPGHISFCRGRADGPRDCRPLGAGGTSSLAIADLDGDGFNDVVQGDHVPDATAPLSGGVVRVWHGSEDGLAAEPTEITQASPSIADADEQGDAFGWAVDAGDLDADGYADIVVAAPGEDDSAGAVTIVRGGRSGWPRTGNVRFDKDQPSVSGDAVPGERFGWTIGLLRLPGDDHLDLAVTARDAARLSDAILVVEGSPGAFAPGETGSWRPLRLAEAVRRPAIDRIRVGRGGEG